MGCFWRGHKRFKGSRIVQMVFGWITVKTGGGSTMTENNGTLKIVNKTLEQVFQGAWIDNLSSKVRMNSYIYEPSQAWFQLFLTWSDDIYQLKLLVRDKFSFSFCKLFLFKLIRIFYDFYIRVRHPYHILVLNYWKGQRPLVV